MRGIGLMKHAGTLCVCLTLLAAGVRAHAQSEPPASTGGGQSPYSVLKATLFSEDDSLLPVAVQEPKSIQRPLETPPPLVEIETIPDDFIYVTPSDAPLGYTGPSGVLPRAYQQDNHFVPMEDRWRIGFPDWDRYGKGHPRTDDYPFVRGDLWNPYKQNVLKGDYPILGQNIFFVMTGTSKSLFELRQTPITTTPFESTRRPFKEEFFGDPNQFIYFHNFIVSFDLFRGDAAFRQPDWRIKLTPIFNINYLDVNELAVVNPNVLRGTTRGRSWFTLEEWFVESKIADLGPDFDFLSVRVGAQPFTSDFRGFIFSDINRGVRIFGNRLANRDQYNVVLFRQLEKDTNSGLNTFKDRNQTVLIANYYRQDFIWPGYTAQVSAHYNHDEPTFRYDQNSTLIRPDPVGVFKPHTLDVVYLGFAGDGHINRFNINHAFYWALGRDSLNPLANQGVDISAQMAALEVSYDRDWMRFRSSIFWASGDEEINNSRATGFDAIFDNPNFAGGEFSYWQRQAIRLFGVNLTNRESLVPSLKSSKIQGQSNFVNPGLFLINGGIDMEVTPKLRVITNTNFLLFDTVDVLRQFTFQKNIDRFIGTDISMGVEYRPLLSNNIIITSGISTLLPSRGFRDIFSDQSASATPLYAGFLDVVLTF